MVSEVLAEVPAAVYSLKDQQVVAWEKCFLTEVFLRCRRVRISSSVTRCCSDGQKMCIVAQRCIGCGRYLFPVLGLFLFPP